MEMIDMVITKKLFFRSKIEKCKQLFPVAGFGTSMGFHSPGQLSLLSTPWKPYHETHFI